MSKKSMIITGIVALVVVAVAAVLLLMPRGNSRTPLAATPGAESSTTSASTTTGTAPSTTTSTTSTTQNGDQTGSTTTGTNGSGTTNATQARPEGKLAVYPPLPDPTVPPASLTKPIAAGKPLPRLSPDPGKPISALPLSAIPEGSSYSIVMRPYGMGPDLLFGSRIVIQIDSIIPVGSAPARASLKGTQMLVLVDTTHRGTVTKGGTYSATITWLSDGTKLLPVLRLAKLK